MVRWKLYTAATMALWGAWGALSKPLSSALSAWEVQALSSVGLLPVVFGLYLGGGRNAGRGVGFRRGFALAFGSGVLCSLGNVAYYQALGMGGKAADVTPITALYPMVTVVLALVFLGERLRLPQVAGVCVALGAMYCFNVGSEAGWLTPWVAVALIPILLWGVAAILQKVATEKTSAEWCAVAFLLGQVPLAILTPLWEPIDLGRSPAIWTLLLLLGFAYGAGNWTLMRAYSTGGKASVVTPLSGLYSLVTIPLAVLFLQERVTFREGVGIALALGAVVGLCRDGASDAPVKSTVASA